MCQVKFRLLQLYGSKVYLFESSPGKPISRFTAHTLLSRAGRKIGRRLHPHMLRHTRATDLLNRGEPLSSVAAYMGHSSPEITARFYLHGLPKASRIMSGLD
ncbi:tyrosine-type recombinase/integrase [Turneriella parva]|uniref:tyrosine-type recombinase/integrase n=1 Tax=Turneriella parva TaxID=29510 RepID=UPI0009FFD1BE